jgi:hypothetical protein
MTLHLAVVILTVWATAVILGIIGRVINNEEMVNFSDICAWTVAGVSSVGCALYVLGHHIEEAKEPPLVSQQCVVHNGTEYCNKRIETETIIIDVDGNDNITVKIK